MTERLQNINVASSELLPTPEQTEVEKLVAAGDEASLRAALELEPANPDVIVALAEVVVGAAAATTMTMIFPRRK